MKREKLAMAVQDDNGRTRGLLEATDTPGFYHVYSGSGYQYWGAGMTLDASIEMVRQKSGMDVEELPPVKMSDLTIKKGAVNKINGFQGGGFYRVDTVMLGDRHLGTLQTKQQPRRRVYESHTSVDGYGVRGHDLGWMLRWHGFRLENQ